MINQEFRALIDSAAEEAPLREAAVRMGILHSLERDALSHLSLGDTGVEEILAYLPTEETLEPSAGASSPASEAHVLVVDDDPTVRLAVRKVLEAQGLAVREVADGREVMTRLRGGLPELVILDLEMPEVDGYEVIRTLRGELGAIDLPVLILTSNADERSQAHALELGADDYVSKPVKARLLAARVKAAIRRGRRRE